MSAEEQRQRQDLSFVIHADAQDRPARLAVQAVDPGESKGRATARVLTPLSHYVESLTWSPDGKEIAYAAAPMTGFMAQYAMRIYAVPVAGGTPRTIVDRPGMNSTPQFSPDGTHIAFISTNGQSSIMAPRGLAVAPSGGGPVSGIRSFPSEGRVGE